MLKGYPKTNSNLKIKTPHKKFRNRGIVTKTEETEELD